jgi:pentatricopeptide repeat domain-containing protein 1
MYAGLVLQANFITYSALISACSSCGRWQEAEKTFSQMLEASKSDTECCPNTITYSSLITACERGGRLDRALDWYQQMQKNGVEPDFIIYRWLSPALKQNLGRYC